MFISILKSAKEKKKKNKFHEKILKTENELYSRKWDLRGSRGV
jgi:hypothetical protein